MSPTDVPPVTTEHSAEILGDAFPTTSETGTVEAVIACFQEAAQSVGTSDTAETMFALIEANATGQTPENLISEFTEDQRAAFDRALRQMNMGQGASVMAQDILNTKIQLNGTVTSFEAAVQELIASYGATGPTSPRSQHEFTEKYNQLLDQAKSSAKGLGSNHKQTQDSLVSGVQKGATPEIPSTMAPPAPGSNATVPGMPDGALGSMLQQVGGIMSKPPNLPMPKLDQAIQPAAQSAQSAIGELMKKVGGDKGVPVSNDALSKLVSSTGQANQGSSLSGPRAADSHSPGSSSGAMPGGMRPMSASQTDNARHSATAPSQDVHEDSEESRREVTATAPTAPVHSSGPDQAVPSVTLSSGDAATGDESLSAAGTHLSSGEAATASSPLSHAAPAHAGAGAVPGGGAMGPMMGPMMGGAAGGAPASAGSKSEGSPDSVEGKVVAFNPRERHETPAELLDFGANLKGLDHATDQQLIAASIVAGLVRSHRRMGLATEVAVGVSAGEVVFVTSDGLGFLPLEMKAAPHLKPLITAVPDEFVSRWIGCDQPWRPLLEAAGQRMVGPFDAVVATDPDAESQGVLALTAEQVDAVNIAAGSAQRWELDSIDADDVDDVVAYLCQVWGRPVQAPMDLEDAAVSSRWRGDRNGAAPYARVWARYLLSAGMADLQAGDTNDARYMLRSALRVPQLVGAMA